MATSLHCIWFQYISLVGIYPTRNIVNQIFTGFENSFFRAFRRENHEFRIDRLWCNEWLILPSCSGRVAAAQLIPPSSATPVRAAVSIPPLGTASTHTALRARSPRDPPI